jgi:phage baseplate assembly protein W
MAGEITVSGLQQELVIGAQGLQEILQNVRVILTTLAGQVLLDRGFAGPGEYVDAPINTVRRRKLAAWVQAIEKHEPRVRCQKIYFENAGDTEDGEMYPVAVIRVKEEYLDEL